MFNISRSTHSKYPIFGIHMDILTNIQLSGKNLQLEPLGKKYSDLIEELAPKTMSSSMIYSYSNQFFSEVLFSLARQWRSLKPINGRIDNKMADFFKCPIVKP